MSATQLSEKVRQLTLDLGADLVGFAELSPLSGWMEEMYGDVWQPYRSAVSLSVGLPRDVVLQLLKAPSHTYLRYYATANARIDDICMRLAIQLEKMGYSAFPIPASQQFGEMALEAIFSHRAVAHQAGLGWIGKSCSLIRPDRGPFHRLGTVLTDAEFVYGALVASQCGSCHACIDICPVGALKNVALEESTKLEDRFDAVLCQKNFDKAKEIHGEEICGLCIAACPYGRRK